MKITRQTAEQFRSDFNTAVKDLETKYGFSIDLGNIRFSSTQLTSKITAKPNAIDGVDIEKVEFQKNARLYGFAESDYNRQVKIDGNMYRIIGFSNSRRKYTVILLNSAGNRIVATEDTVKRNLV